MYHRTDIVIIIKRRQGIVMNYRGISIIVIFVFCWVLVVPVLADEGFWRSRSIDAERDDLGSYCSLKIDGN